MNGLFQFGMRSKDMQIIDVYYGRLSDYKIQPDALSNWCLCFDMYMQRLISELGINFLKAVKETLEHLDTKTRVRSTSGSTNTVHAQLRNARIDGTHASSATEHRSNGTS